MPFPADAIPGQASLARKREKAKRLAGEDTQNLPNWAKSRTPDEMETYVNENVTDMASAILVMSKLAWMAGALRDYNLLKQEDD